MSESHPLSDDEIDRIAERVSGARVSINKGGNDGAFRRVIETVLVAAIVALVGVVWNLSNSVSILSTQVTYISTELTQLRARSP